MQQSLTLFPHQFARAGARPPPLCDPRVFVVAHAFPADEEMYFDVHGASLSGAFALAVFIAEVDPGARIAYQPSHDVFTIR
jgi:hypothetical protein